jgi:hypothetical protein
MFSQANFELPAGARLTLWAVLATAPLAVWRRRLLPAILLVSPIAMTLLGHLLRAWPWGPFRTNQFLLPYVVLATLYAVELLAGGIPRRLGSLAATGVALALIALHVPTDLRAHDRKSTPGDSSVKAALEIVRTHHVGRRPKRLPGRIPLVAGRHAGPPIEYYLHQHARLRHRFAVIREEYEIIHVGGWGGSMWRDRRIPDGPLWVITEHPENTAAAEAYLERHCEIELLRHLPGGDLVAHARCP